MSLEADSVGKIEIRDPELAERLRRETASGEAVLQAGDARYVVVPVRFELTDPEEVHMALDAASPAKGRTYTPDEALRRLAELRAARGG